LNLDLPAIRDYVTQATGQATALEWAWQVGVAVGALALGWLGARALCHEVTTNPRWKFGAGEFDRVAFPFLAVGFLWIGKAILGGYQPVLVLDVARSLLIALGVIRFAEYVLGHILPHGTALRRTVRVVAWIAWIVVALHLTGLLPQVLDALDGVGFTVGKDKGEVTLLSLVKGALAMALTIMLALWIARVTETRVMASASLEATTRVVIAKVVRVATLFLAIFIALPLAGIDLTTLSIFGGALGVGLGFGLQKIASNYVSGFIVLLDRSLRFADPLLVGHARDVALRDVVPGAHHEAVVDGDRPRGGMRKDEAQRERFRQRQLAHEGHEIPAVGAQAVHPDDGAARLGAGGELDVFQRIQALLLGGRRADLGRKAFTTASRVSMYGPPIRSTQ